MAASVPLMLIPATLTVLPLATFLSAKVAPVLARFTTSLPSLLLLKVTVAVVPAS